MLMGMKKRRLGDDEGGHAWCITLRVRHTFLGVLSTIVIIEVIYITIAFQPQNRYRT